MLEHSLETICGLTESHLEPINSTHLAHRAAADAFKQMAADAARQGHNLQPASAFRSFQRQAWIWNRKIEGQVPLKGLDGNLLPPEASLSERLNAALRWSAIPGCSRHHWGSDFDVYDPDKLGTNSLQLEPWEYQNSGPFASLTEWLQCHARKYDFYFPYDSDRGGVAPEPWHISYAPVATRMLESLNAEKVKTVLEQQNVAGKAELLDRLDELLKRYVFNVAAWNSGQ